MASLVVVRVVVVVVAVAMALDEVVEHKEGMEVAVDLVASDLGRRPFWSWSRPFSSDLGGHGQLLPFVRPKVAKIL